MLTLKTTFLNSLVKELYFNQNLFFVVAVLRQSCILYSRPCLKQPSVISVSRSYVLDDAKTKKSSLSAAGNMDKE
jgi:hypothetical protein